MMAGVGEREGHLGGLQGGRHFGPLKDGGTHVHAHLPILQQRGLNYPCRHALQ